MTWGSDIRAAVTPLAEKFSWYLLLIVSLCLWSQKDQRCNHACPSTRPSDPPLSLRASATKKPSYAHWIFTERGFIPLKGNHKVPTTIVVRDWAINTRQAWVPWQWLQLLLRMSTQARSRLSHETLHEEDTRETNGIRSEIGLWILKAKGLDELLRSLALFLLLDDVRHA